MYGNPNLDFRRIFLVSKHYCAVKDASDARGFKIPMVRELDAVANEQVSKFLRCQVNFTLIILTASGFAHLLQ